MRSLKLAALNAQVMLTSPFRRARIRKAAAEGTAPISVSFYHRVADTCANDWTISRERFLRHIDYCKSRFEMISLAEVQRRVRSQQSHNAAMSITFDDGYRDNCEFALPLLIQRGIPCTYFVTTCNVRGQMPFPHDVKSGEPLAVNTVQQIRELSDAGVEIGCHTRQHVDFSKVHDQATVRDEVVRAKSELEQMIGREVRYFAFPFGLPAQLTQAAIEAVSEAGFDGFCSAYGAYNLVGRDWFHIRRFHGDPEFARLKNWLSIDPRKVRQEPEVRYFLPPAMSFKETFPMMGRTTPLFAH
ncbi:polysaccharide deacetylase family protein [Rubripirellula tenax]|nr:polysaccharide deacetylase family protein [Rubripirellula tenax]